MVCTKTPISSLQVRKAYDMDEDDETGRENFRIKANLLFVIFDRLFFKTYNCNITGGVGGKAGRED